MQDDETPDSKKQFPSGFIFLLILSLLTVLFIQGLMETRIAKVNFSYQLEHLVNLNLVRSEESRKIALNDNLVTFSGVFRDNLAPESKERYKYLELLESRYSLQTKKTNLNNELSQDRQKVIQAANWYLNLAGIVIPPEGYIVVDTNYDTSDENNAVVIDRAQSLQVESIISIKKALASVNVADSRSFAEQLLSFVRNMRSPLLGIGDEPMKQRLKEIETTLQQGLEQNKLATVNYSSLVNELDGMIVALGASENGVRLQQLRSVREYKADAAELLLLVKDQEDVETSLNKAREAVASVIWFFNNKELSTRQLEKQDPEIYNQWFQGAKHEWEQFPANRGSYFKAPDQPSNLVLERKFKSEQPPSNYLIYLFNFLPVLLVIGVLYFLFARQMKGMGAGGAMNFGKSPAKLLQKGQHKVTFKDVAGADEALEELQEIVEFLKAPQKFTALGGRIPKGVLCVGPPGTGKTLIARAVAGEADRPFFSISGSDFVEMFVGVGASRIRDMFNQAKKNAPCIIFMDEIDAVGRHRGAGIGGGHDEREQTLNQLLVEMDGFDSNEGVILMAATNRPDVLDKALLRPGRFDRRVVLGLPDIKGRYEILKVHARKIKLDDSVDLMAIAKTTPGTAGAELENILNEAALLAARRGRTAVTNTEVSEARDKVLYGKERRSLELDEQDKLSTAYHESGHAIVSLLVEHGDPIDKVTIIPRGMSLGATMFQPKKNRTSYWRRELLDQLKVLMGGRCAEQIFLGDVSSGAQQDISQATNLARSMVCQWGMSELGPVAYTERASESSVYLGVGGGKDQNYAEETAKAIDKEVHRFLDQANTEATKLIEENREKVELMTKMLMEFETLDRADIDEIMKGSFSIENKRARVKEAHERHKPTESENVIAPPLRETKEVTASS